MHHMLDLHLLISMKTRLDIHTHSCTTKIHTVPQCSQPPRKKRPECSPHFLPHIPPSLARCIAFTSDKEAGEISQNYLYHSSSGRKIPLVCAPHEARLGKATDCHSCKLSHSKAHDPNITNPTDAALQAQQRLNIKNAEQGSKRITCVRPKHCHMKEIEVTHHKLDHQLSVTNQHDRPPQVSPTLLPLLKTSHHSLLQPPQHPAEHAAQQQPPPSRPLYIVPSSFSPDPLLLCSLCHHPAPLPLLRPPRPAIPRFVLINLIL
ncbi:unnamed protein product [Pleuronectes platessa]|uniref:Uncharacterized protein n=1 Tax=Pleuronectes platessa TaxID=8262 RepID=A0A9N7UQ45_PLEPL|nr:unnamed protein product [Pleuronectes platessa]